MPQQDFQINFILIYFIYGLAFFSMGLAMMLESRRSPLLAEGRVLRPLSFFGFLHGFHEWFEMALIFREWAGLPVPGWIPLARLVLLVSSFTLLLIFGLRVLRPQKSIRTVKDLSSSLVLVALYLAVVILTGLERQTSPILWVGLADAFSRWLLAVPGAGMAALALNRQSRQAREENRGGLAPALQLAALGFAVYSLSQVFVSPSDFFPGRYVNTLMFLSVTSFPIQLVRGSMAVLITVSLIHASQVIEAERGRQLLAAQQARLEALEQVQHELVEREAMRRELLRHTVIAQEEERARIARELHDETAQFLTALRLNLSALHNTVSKKHEVSELIERLQTLSRQMSQGIYRMVHDLRPAQLDDLGLVAALQHLVDEERRRSRLEIDLSIDGPRQRLDSLVETVFFRVAQEALTNIARHAQCDRAVLQLTFESQQVTLRIVDAGCGFNVNTHHSPPRGWGLAGMRERAESVGASLRLQSEPGRGTQVELTASSLQPEFVILEESPHEYRPLDAG